MSDRDEKQIRISLKVSLPSTGSLDAGRVVVTEESCGTPSHAGTGRAVFPVEAKAIQEPTSGQQWKVRMAGSGYGVICARGTGHDDADQVKGYCNLISPTDPNPPLSADEALIENGSWQLNNVPGATVGFNILRVWYLKNEMVIHAENLAFHGIESTHTECEGSGTSVAAQSVRRQFLPSQFTVMACGFFGGLECLNGAWTLHVKPQADPTDEVRWTSGPCAADVQVELVAELSTESACLVFRSGTTEVRYRKAAGQWNPVNICDFADITTRAVPPGSSVPAVVQVHPGTAS